MVYVSYSEDKCLATPLHLQNFLYSGYSVIRLYRFDYVRKEGFFLVGITDLSCRIEFSLQCFALFISACAQGTHAKSLFRTWETEKKQNTSTKSRWMEVSTECLFSQKKNKILKLQAKWGFFHIVFFLLASENIRLWENIKLILWSKYTSFHCWVVLGGWVFFVYFFVWFFWGGG